MAGIIKEHHLECTIRCEDCDNEWIVYLPARGASEMPINLSLEVLGIHCPKCGSKHVRIVMCKEIRE